MPLASPRFQFFEPADDESPIHLHTLAQRQAFLDGTVAVRFVVTAEQRYDFIARTVRRFGYGRLKRTQKAVVLRSQLDEHSGLRTRLARRLRARP